jgi:hypothetical protein
MSRASFHCRARAAKSSIFPWMIAKSPPAENTLSAPVRIAALTRSHSCDVAELGVQCRIGRVHPAVLHCDAENLGVRAIELSRV